MLKHCEQFSQPQRFRHKVSRMSCGNVRNGKYLVRGIPKGDILRIPVLVKLLYTVCMSTSLCHQPTAISYDCIRKAPDTSMFRYGLQQTWVSVIATNHAHNHHAFSLTSRIPKTRRPYRESEGYTDMSPEKCLLFSQCCAPRIQLDLHTLLRPELTIWKAQIATAFKPIFYLYPPPCITSKGLYNIPPA